MQYFAYGVLSNDFAMVHIFYCAADHRVNPEIIHTHHRKAGTLSHVTPSHKFNDRTFNLILLFDS